MKRMLAMMLALMMLLGMTAVAETAPAAADMSQSALISNLTGVTIDIENAGQVQHLDMADLGVSCVVDTEDTLRFLLTADKGDEILTFALAEIQDNKLRVGLKGIDRTFEYDIPEVPGMDMASLTNVIRQNLPALMGQRMPEIKVTALPKIDLSTLLPGETTEADGVRTTAVDISAEMVSMVLSMVVQLAKTSTENVPQGKQAIEYLEQLINNGFSFAVKGTITDTDAEQSANIGIYMSDNGETAEAPTLLLNTTTAENSATLAIDLPSEDSSYTVGQLSVVTDPEAETLDSTLDIAGMISLALKMHKHDDLQCVDLTLQAPGTDAKNTLEYGVQDGQDYYAFKSEMGEGNSFNCVVTGNAIDNGYSGAIAFNTKGTDSGVAFNASYFELLGDLDLATALNGYELPTETATFDTLTSDEINSVISPILEAIQAAAGIAAPVEEAPAA